MAFTLRGVRAVDIPAARRPDGPQDRRVDLEIADGCVAAITPAGPTADHTRALTVIPGMVDLHVHGGGGASFDALDSEQIRAVAAYHHRHGTTTMLASLVTAPTDQLRRSCALLGELTRAGVVAGIHLEGPFLSARRCGAQDPRYIVAPDADLLDRLWQDAAGEIAMVTVACEQPGALEVIAWCVEHDVLAAVGHTDADADATRRAVEAGARIATHLFNAMPPLHHRAPGPVGVLLADPRVTCELIFDGDHVAATVARIVVAAAGPERVAAVTDAIAASGLPDGRYTLGRLDVEAESGVARLADSGALAGSTTTMGDSLRRVVSWGIALHDAITMHCHTPAQRLGIPEGLKEGNPADLVLLDDVLAIRGVLKAGVAVPGLPLSDTLPGDPD
jgi:N-acetylglucosamine-6-phosphate deacetylase